jgi:hypothetical protein
MSLSDELKKLDEWVEKLPSIGMNTLGGSGSSMYLLDFIMIGAIKRSLGLATGVRSLIESKNMTCCRALIRLQLDTVSRLLAYTYVSNPSEVATKILGGEPLYKFKSRDGNFLRDKYLIDRMAENHPWVRAVYDYTSGYVHFSEKQIFDSIHFLIDGEERTVQFQISKEDENFPEDSWIEVASCFNEMLSIQVKLMATYAQEKNEEM